LIFHNLEVASAKDLLNQSCGSNAAASLLKERSIPTFGENDTDAKISCQHYFLKNPEKSR
jgi:hypothetical protein